MLCELSIKNFAIIDDLNISFSDGLTILSGETGAGKSIIISAVNLLLGSRASAKLIRTGTDFAELEAFFKIPVNSKSAKKLEEHGLSSNDDLIIRRVITRTDRHKIYINGRISTIALLTSLTENLASISGQHAHQGLLKEELHLQLLDQFGSLLPLKNRVYKIFHEIVPLSAKLKKLQKAQTGMENKLELMQFQQQEIKDAKVLPDEDKQLELEIKRLKNSESLYKTVFNTIEELYSSDGSISEKLNIINKDMEKAVNIDSNLTKENELLVDIRFKIEDTAEKLRIYLQNLDMDGKALEDAQIRLDALQKLKRKYGGSISSILNHLKKIEQELSGSKNMFHDIAKYEEKLLKLHNKISTCAEELSEKRENISKHFNKRVEKELASLEMPGTIFKIVLKENIADKNTNPYLNINGREVNETGFNHAVFMIAPNIGEALKPLSQTASGGELSRVVLALKAMLAKIDSVETVVFDEVDAGIGGGIAEVVGKKLKELSKYHQIICITHLAQIAKFGTSHYRIVKNITKGRTATSIFSMNHDQRIEEMARMIGGVKITPKTIEHARELLNDF